MQPSVTIQAHPNSARGILVQVEQDGQTTEHTFRLGFNQICVFERLTGQTILSLATRFRTAVGAETIRAFFYATRQDDKKTIEQAGDFIDQIGIGNAMKAMGELIAVAYPQTREVLDRVKAQMEAQTAKISARLESGSFDDALAEVIKEAEAPEVAEGTVPTS